jgi:HlyD family secretion protein
VTTPLPLRIRPLAVPLLSLALLASAEGCRRNNNTRIEIQTAAVTRRTITQEAVASGAVEPINVVDVRSKSSGQISEMTVETGSQVKKGDLLVQLDTRDVRNQYDQAKADLDAANAKLKVSETQLKRNEELFKQKIITAQELETAQLDYTNSQASIIRAKTSLDLAQQRLEDATVRAPISGTIIAKTVSLGQVIASATSSASGGTSLLQMADLSVVRVRANFNETDIAYVSPGQEATATFDAYPDRPFRGVVEKIEPQAVVQQSVTMFPVLVTLQNSDGSLKPGMNGEVSVLVDSRENALAVPNDAIRQTRDALSTSKLLGLNADSVQASIREQMAAMGGGFGGGAGGNGVRGGRGQGNSGNSGNSGNGRRQSESRGEVALAETDQGDQRQGGRRGGMNLPQVTDQDCARVTAAFAKNPKAQEALQALRGQRGGAGGAGGGGNVDMQRIRAVSDSIYTVLGLDAGVARACQFRNRQAQSGAGGGDQQRGPGADAANRAGRSGGGGAAGGGAATAAAPQGGGERGPVPAGELSMARTRSRPALVYVAQGTGYAPRVIRVGLSDLDYTEVAAGLQEGEQVVLLAALQLQAQRDSANARARAMQSGVPGMQKGGTMPGGGGGPGRGRGF